MATMYVYLPTVKLDLERLTQCKGKPFNFFINKYLVYRDMKKEESSPEP
jgi:hypothetical protein